MDNAIKIPSVLAGKSENLKWFLRISYRLGSILGWIWALPTLIVRKVKGE